MKTLSLITALFFAVAIQAQNTETDSLKRKLAITAESPQRVLVLESLSYAYLSSYPDTALQYALQGLQLAQKLGDRKGEAYCINALGNVYFSVGDYPQALEMYLQSLQMKDRLKKQEQAIAVTYFNIANVYTEQEDYVHALSYLFKTKQVDEKAKDSAGILYDLYSLSSVYLRMKKTDSALYYAQQSYELAQRINDENLIAAIVNNYGEIHAALNRFSEAADDYHRSITYAKTIKDHEVMAADYYGLAKVFKQKQQFDSSIFYARKALQLAEEAPFLKQVLETSTFLAGLFKTIRQFDSAFHYQELSIATKDSLFNVEKIKKVQNLKLMEQQREQSIAAAKVAYRNKIRLYSVLTASVVFLILAFVFWRNNRQKQKALLLLKQQQEETDKQKEKVEQAYNELRATQTQLIQQEKMASLGELTAGIAHEIQNPLNFINNFSEVSAELAAELKKELAQGNRQEVNAIANDIADNLQKVVYHGKRADSIVKSMLQHSRASKGDRQDIDINALIEEYLQLAYHGMRARDKSFNAVLETHFDITIEKVNAVPQDIGRVLLNLFNNAFYAMMQKKKELNGSYEPVIVIRTKALNDQLEITIHDNGIGIPQRVVDKIFQPFFTTKPTGQGTGLGLSLSYDIINAHGGDITVETKEGAYTKFIISLPIADG